MRRALLAAACVFATACISAPAPGDQRVDSPPPPTLTPQPTPVPVLVQPVVPEGAPSPAATPVAAPTPASAAPTPASIPLTALAVRSGADLRVSLDQALQENAYLTAAAMQAASSGRLDELIGISAMLDQCTLGIAEIVGNLKGQAAAQALTDGLRAQTSDLITYSQSQPGGQSPSAPADLDQQRATIAGQLATGSFSEQAADTVVQRRTEQALSLANSLGSHDAAQTSEQLATLIDSSGDLSEPLASAMASQIPSLSPPTTDGADIDLRLLISRALLEHVYLSGAAAAAAADGRTVDAQAYSGAAADADDDLANELDSEYGDDVGNGVGDRLRDQTQVLVSTASGGDRRQATADVERLRGEIDTLLAGANPLLAPGLLTEELRASDQPMLSAVDAFATRDFATAYARLHEAARQSQKPAETLATAIVDRYPGRYLVLPSSPGLSTGRGGRGSHAGSRGGGHR